MTRIQQSPLDRGYSYVIAVAVFLAHILQNGITWTVGVWYTVFMDKYQAQSKAIALIASLNTASFYAAGPVASLLTNKFGARKVCCFGAVFGASGLILSVFAPNITTLYITFGVITGFGIGLTYVPAVTMVGYYFEKRRSIAVGFAVSGCGFGTFLYPPIINYFLEAYSISGALLIMGAITLNLMVVGALFRPWVGDRNDIASQESTNDDHLDSYHTDNILTTKPCSVLNSKSSLHSVRENGLRHKIALKGSNATLNSLVLRQRFLNEKGNVCRTISVCDLQLGSRKSIDNIHRANSKDRASLIGSAHFSHPQQNTNLEKNHEETIKVGEYWRKTLCDQLDADLMCNLNFIILAINNCLFCFGLSVVYVHLGAYVKQTLTLSIKESNQFFSVIGIVNFIGRLAFGALCQIEFFKPIWVYSVAFFATGVSTCACALRDEYAWLMAYAVIFGFLSGGYGSLLCNVVIQVTELDKLSSAYGYLLIFDAVGTVLGAPLAGMLFDITNVYKNSFYLGGSFMMLSAIIMIYPIRHGKSEKEIQEQIKQDIN